MNYLYYILSILVFTIFDIIGYYLILTKKETTEPFKIYLYLYRFLQTSFQIGISIALYFIDIRIMFCFIISWWFGLCDYLYYIFTKRNIWKWINMYWLWWTPFGIILNLFKKDITGKYLTVSSILIFIFSIIYLLVR